MTNEIAHIFFYFMNKCDARVDNKLLEASREAVEQIYKNPSHPDHHRYLDGQLETEISCTAVKLAEVSLKTAAFLNANSFHSIRESNQSNKVETNKYADRLKYNRQGEKCFRFVEGFSFLLLDRDSRAFCRDALIGIKSDVRTARKTARNRFFIRFFILWRGGLIVCKLWNASFWDFVKRYGPIATFLNWISHS